MSFRKRSDIIGEPRRVPLPTPNRGPGITGPGTPGTPGTLPGRGIPVRPNVPVARGMPLRTPPATNAVPSQQMAQLSLQETHPGVKPSITTSQPTTSTGCNDLDKILLHQGLPLGSSLLIEESGTTDFNSILLKLFGAEGIVHNRLDKAKSNTHVVCIGNPHYAKELPGVYKGSKRDIKKQKVAENESRVSVQNLASNDLKIAWRYGLQKNVEKVETQTDDDYCHQFDITSRLVPSPGIDEVTHLNVPASLKMLVQQLETVLKKHSDKVVRVVMPQLLHPAIYSPRHTDLSEILPFICSVRALLRKYTKAVFVGSISTQLFPKENAVLPMLEKSFDGVIHLEPFNQDMLAFLEKAYKNQQNKVSHGLVHVIKVPILSDKGEMLVMRSEYAFKNGKKKFEIEDWSIPVEDEADDEAHGHTEHGHTEHGHTEHGHQHTQNIEF